MGREGQRNDIQEKAKERNPQESDIGCESEGERGLAPLSARSSPAGTPPARHRCSRPAVRRQHMWATTVEVKVSSNAQEALAGGERVTSLCPNEEQTSKHTCKTATAKTSTGAALDDSNVAWFQRKMVIRKRDVIRAIEAVHRSPGDVEADQHATRMWQDLPKQAPTATFTEELGSGFDVEDANSSNVQTPLSWTPVPWNDEEEEMRFPSQRQIVDGSSRRQSAASPANKLASFLKSEVGSENALILSSGHEITSPGEGERRVMMPPSKTHATEHGSVELLALRNMEDADVNLRRSARRGEDAVNMFKQGQVQLVVLRARSLSPSALSASQWRPSTAASAALATVKQVRDTKASLLRKNRGANVGIRRIMLETIESDRGSDTQMMPWRSRRRHMIPAKAVLKDRDLATDFDMKLTCLQMQQTAAQNGFSE